MGVFGCERARARWKAKPKFSLHAGVFAGRQYFKDVLVDGQSHLLIIREETELPGAQVGWRPREPS